ncbi:hypothetical protein [Nitrosomonas ureae]|uniref:Uncharacterized protein n=1 Tax=Nitrosomonas ureae TaxID=44577 RepID=A0A286A245_9PROT|nr:hypothetical protein [Nitrosomonas ureae]SOD15983.1 hypothetical protein SAMN06297164_0175 [Nitrosomonas ureae]
MLDIIHESIDIAKKSTVPDTKISRLRVANDRFKFLLGYIDKYDFIEITNNGLHKIQQTIDELHNQFLVTKIYDIAAGEIPTARDFLKQATQLKKEKRYDEACDKLKEAYSAYGSNELLMKDFLRLPMYLQLAGRSDEGWEFLNEFRKRNNDVFNRVDIAKQIKIFLRKEKKYKLSILFSAWEVCAIIERDEANVQGCFDLADKEATDEDYDFLRESLKNKEVYGQTPSGNPITEFAFGFFTKDC